MDVDKVPAFLTPKWQWVILDLEVTSMIHEIKNFNWHQQNCLNKDSYWFHYVIGQIWFQVNFDLPRVILNFECLLAPEGKGNPESTEVKSKLTWNQIRPVTLCVNTIIFS